MDTLLMIVAFGALMYFLLIRPQQKRLKEHQAAIGALAPGSRVLLTSGMFATVSHLGERHAIVELAPGVEVTIIKANIARATTPEEEEFEFADDGEGPEDDVVVVEPVDPTLGSESFDPRGDEDISADELQRRYDAN